MKFTHLLHIHTYREQFGFQLHNAIWFALWEDMTLFVYQCKTTFKIFITTQRVPQYKKNTGVNGRFCASYCFYLCTNLGKDLTAALFSFHIPFCTLAADTVHQACQKTKQNPTLYIFSTQPNTQS